MYKTDTDNPIIQKSEEKQSMETVIAQSARSISSISAVDNIIVENNLWKFITTQQEGIILTAIISIAHRKEDNSEALKLINKLITKTNQLFKSKDNYSFFLAYSMGHAPSIYTHFHINPAPQRGVNPFTINQNLWYEIIQEIGIIAERLIKNRNNQDRYSLFTSPEQQKKPITSDSNNLTNISP